LDTELASPAAPAPLPLTDEERADQEAQRRLLAAGVISEIKPSGRKSRPNYQSKTRMRILDRWKTDRLQALIEQGGG
jgi:hypothetical protein